MTLTFFILFLSYLLGSFPSGFIYAKNLKGIDLRYVGSGSTGATNVLRNIGKWPALVVFIVDVLKGLIAVKIAHFFLSDNIFQVLAGLFAITGHIWPIWLELFIQQNDPFFGGCRNKSYSTGFTWLRKV